MSIHIAIYCHFNFNQVRDDRTSFSHEFKLSTIAPTPDRLFPQIKQRSPLTTQNPIAYLLKSNSDRPFITQHPLA
ncbi:MAG: hypothetical protein WCQ26_07420 [Pseudanabaena sp. ELA748]